MNGDSGLLIVAAVSELMPNPLGQVLLVDLATLHRLITAHAVRDTGNAGDLQVGASGKGLNWRRNRQPVVSVCVFVCAKAPVMQILLDHSVAVAEKKCFIPLDIQRLVDFHH